MTREEAKQEMKECEGVEECSMRFKIIDDIYDDFENKSCIDCRWCKLGGEFENDECHNTSLSAHLEQGTMVSQDFCCNRYEARDKR